MSELPPDIRVSLTGRERYEPEFVEDAQPEGMALPAPCLRRLQVPHAICSSECAGRQRDGGCAAELVRGRDTWRFTIDREGFWVLS